MGKTYNRPLTLLFLRRGDEILLAMKKRGFGEGKYNGIGGKVEKEETIEQAAIREWQEEIGVTPKDIQPVATLDFSFPLKHKMQGWNKVHVFISEQWEGHPTETEEMKPEWFKISEIPYDNMWVDDRYWLPDVLAGRTLTADFSFDINEVLTEVHITFDTTADAN